MSYDKTIDQKWQKRWDDTDAFKTKGELNGDEYYVLEMFPYPSGSGLHMGHCRVYSIGDALARFRIMQGKHVLHPMGYDAFGLPAENAAIQRDINPADWTEQNIQTMKTQQKKLGLSYDWNRELATCNPSYYKWNQWIFLQLYKEGLAYKSESVVNWCPDCNTVLANEQVENGQCWRCDADVEEKTLDQWFFKITEYAEDLLADLQHLDWPKKVKTMQKNWIGRSEGASIPFDIEGETVDVFTTRPDTVYGVSALILAPENPLGQHLAEKHGNTKEYSAFVKDVKNQTREERGTGKKGLFTGAYATHPLTGQQIPVWIGNFVLPEYGTGAIMAVPAHDERDYEFATKYGLDITRVIEGDDLPYTGHGPLCNSDSCNGHHSEEAQERIVERIEGAEETVSYKLRDWTISRQRYWGTPIPIVYCDECGIVPVPEENLPLKLPTDVSFTGEGNPLETSETFKHTTCPQCGSDARRETDTMDTFMGSSWYFLRYLNPDNDEEAFNKDQADAWLPVDKYIGGIEHAVLHLLYARFLTKFFASQGLTKHVEPFQSLLTQGMVHLEGSKMSKSKGNVVNPLEIIDEYGADTARMYTLFLGAPTKQVDWSNDGVEAMHAFLQRCYTLLEERHEKEIPYTDEYVKSKVHRTVKNITQYMEEDALHKAVGAVMELQKILSGYENDTYIDTFIRVLSPFAPHVAEELWEQQGHTSLCSLQQWPEPDSLQIDAVEEYKYEKALDIKDDINSVKELTGIRNPSEVQVIIASPWKYEVARQVQNLYDTGNVHKAVPKLMQTKLKRKGNEAVSLIQSYQKNPSRLPEVAVNQEDDEEAASKLQCVVLHEEAVDDEKASKALPGKPALILKE